MSGILASAALNTDVRDNLNYLKGLLDGTASADPLIFRDGNTNGLLFGLSGVRVRITTIGVQPIITYNAYTTDGGATWQRDDTTKEAWFFRPGGPASAGADSLLVMRAAAVANPITWTTMLDLGSAGKLTGSAVWNSGRFAVAAGATVDTNHAWSAATLRPAFVLGFYQAGTQTPDVNVQQVCGVGPASTEKVRITVVDGTKVRVVSGDSVSNTVVLYAILGPTS